MNAREKVLEILESWRQQVPAHRYVADAEGNISFPFRGVIVHLVFPKTGPSSESSSDVNCLVVPPYYAKVNFPFDPKIQNILLDYSPRWFHGFFTVGRFPTGDVIAISPQALMSAEILSLESLHHGLVEITTGYWDMTKALHDSGLLVPPPLHRDRFEEIINGWGHPMQMGHETCSIDGILDCKDETDGLFFNNLVGDRPGSPEDRHFRSIPFDVPNPTHHDIYRFDSSNLKSLLKPVKDVLDKCGKKFKFQTLHQGFPTQTSNGRVLADYHVFLGVRFSVEIAEERSLPEQEVEKWKEALVFAFPAWDQTYFGRYSLKDGHIILNISIPLYADKNKHLTMISKLDTEVLRRDVLQLEQRMAKDIKRHQQLLGNPNER